MQGQKKTTVINIHNGKPYDVFIGRGSKWGNPYTRLKYAKDPNYVVKSLDEGLEKYKEYLMTHKELLLAVRRELRGKILGCFCKPEKCHGDILAEIANKL